MHYLTLTVHAGYVAFVVSVEDGDSGLKVISRGSDPCDGDDWIVTALDVISRVGDLHGELVGLDIIHAN